MLYTRKGDDGTSGLFGTKERFPKDSPVYEALGSLDELNSLIGLCRCRATVLRGIDIPQELFGVQQCLFIVQAEIAGADKTLTQANLDALEQSIEKAEGMFENPHAFVIPGATELSAFLDYTRTVARRIERVVLSVHDSHPVSPASAAYLNRLSSFLYALARLSAQESGTPETTPSY